MIYNILGGLFANFLGLFAVFLRLSASFCAFPGLFASFRVFPVLRYPAKYRKGNGSFRSYSRSDPGSFRSYSLWVRSFRPRSFRPDLRGGSFRPSFGGPFRPTLFYIVFRVIKSFSC